MPRVCVNSSNIFYYVCNQSINKSRQIVNAPNVSFDGLVQWYSKRCLMVCQCNGVNPKTTNMTVTSVFRKKKHSMKYANVSSISTPQIFPHKNDIQVHQIHRVPWKKIANYYKTTLD